jgi:signal transduction histidine kinase/ligand-binding sensor domain-containing protein
MFRPINLTKILSSIIIFLLFLISTSTLSYAQRNYLFENISIPEGLSNSSVNYIFQDSNGFLWISTADGLNRYDGNNIKVFKNDPNDSTTLPSNNCFAITEDANGFIWVGVSGNAIARYNPINEKFLRYPIATEDITGQSEYYSALYDSKGNLWFGTTRHGIQKFNFSKERFELVILDSSSTNAQWGGVFGITELKNGNILASDYGSGIKIYNEKLNLFEPFYLKTNYSPNQVQVIFEDASSNLWFGSISKVTKYIPSSHTTEDFDFVSLFKNKRSFDDVNGIIQDNDGYIWVIFYWQGLYRIDPKTKNIQKFNYGFDNPDLTVRIVTQAIYKDKYGVIWLGTLGEGLIKFDPVREPFNYSKIKSEEVRGSGTVTVISNSHQNKEITVGTSAQGLFSYNLENKKSTKLSIEFKPSTAPDGKINIQSLAIDNKGNRWFIYNNLGLHKLDGNNFLSSFKSPYEITTTTYISDQMKFDSSGNLWIASIYGYEKFSTSKSAFTLLPTIMTKRMSENLRQNIYKITRSRDPLASILKVGEASNSEKVFSINENQKVLVICVGEGRMAQGNDGIWDTGSLLTSDGKPIWSMNEMNKTFNDGGGFKNRIAIKCLELKRGDYKISFATDVGHSYGNWNVMPPPDSTWYGIQVLNISESEFNTLNNLNVTETRSDKYLPMERGTSIEFSKKLNNVVWLGSLSNSFFKYELTSGNYKQYNFDSKNKFSPNNSISFILEDSEGIVWIATQNSLIRFDPSTEKIEKYSQKDGLPSNQINSIIEDLQGNLWINTSAGLSKLNKNAPKDKWNFVNFDTRDGLPGFSNSKACWISKDGEIFLGDNDGITYFFPGKINELKPDIIIEDVKISDISLKSDSAEVKLEKSVMITDELDLSYTQNNISFEFASIHYSRPEKNKIIYKLEGFDNHWTSTDRNFASYTNLAPGEYTFVVKGSNGDGIWNDEGKSIRIIINPPWWRTTWAYLFYGFIFLSMIFLTDRIQRRRVIEKERAAAKEKELEQAKEIEKAYNKLKSTQTQLIHAEKMASLGELTAGIAHEIKNPLNFINNFSEISTELLDEMQTELNSNGNRSDGVKEIVSNLKQNLEKINQHGKRADSIVKGMLLHSRGTVGEKVLTNINELLDQYVTLAYHGLRAQDKEFNITIEKDYDNSLEKLNVVPQDISRVFLNLINNACYAANNKKKNSSDDFQPKLEVSTKNLHDRVEIRIKDNGNGIPQSIKEQIFNPFFTTKPTGEGTGLGLSLSYDIVVKQHSGELKFESEEGKYTEFIITIPK